MVRRNGIKYLTDRCRPGMIQPTIQESLQTYQRPGVILSKSRASHSGPEGAQGRLISPNIKTIEHDRGIMESIRKQGTRHPRKRYHQIMKWNWILWFAYKPREWIWRGFEESVQDLMIWLYMHGNGT